MAHDARRGGLRAGLDSAVTRSDRRGGPGRPPCVCAPPPARPEKGSPAAGSLDDHATDRGGMRCSPVRCCWRNAVGIRAGDLGRADRHPPGDCSTACSADAGQAAHLERHPRGDRTSGVRSQNPEAFFPAAADRDRRLEHLDRACRQAQPGQPRPGRVRSRELAHCLRRAGLPAPVHVAATRWRCASSRPRLGA